MSGTYCNDAARKLILEALTWSFKAMSNFDLIWESTIVKDPNVYYVFLSRCCAIRSVPFKVLVFTLRMTHGIERFRKLTARCGTT